MWNNNLNEALCSFSNVSLAHRTWQSRENEIRTLFQTLFDDWSFCAFLMSRLAPSLQSWEKSNWAKVDLGHSIGPFFQLLLFITIAPFYNDWSFLQQLLLFITIFGSFYSFDSFDSFEFDGFYSFDSLEQRNM